MPKGNLIDHNLTSTGFEQQSATKWLNIKCAGHVLILKGASPERAVMTGISKPKAMVSTVRWDLKEAEGRHLL